MENFLRPKDFGFLYTTFFLLLAVLLPPSGVYAQDAAALLQKVRGRLDQVNDYQASGLMKTNVPFLKVPEAQVTVYFKNGHKVKVIKLIPQDENADLVLSTLYIDETRLLILKARTTTRENGTYEVEMSYGKYIAYALPDKVIFTFNTKNYKLPKGITFDYDDGSVKKQETSAGTKGKVELSYSSYIINKGVPDGVFQ